MNVVVFQCPWGTDVRQRVPRHDRPRRRTIFVDEDQPGRIKVRLTVEPGLALLCDVGPCLLADVRRFFNGHVVTVKAAPDRADAKRTPCSVASFSASSIREMSALASIAASGTPDQTSIRWERRSPPCRSACSRPLARHSATHRITLEAETPKRSAAAQRVMPEETAAMVHRRRSDDRTRIMIAGLHPGNHDESDFAPEREP